MKKVIPFIKSSPATQSPAPSSLALDSKGPKPSLDGAIVDHGKLGDLDYEIYGRGVIHIFDKNFRFKKDIYAFETEVRSFNFQKLDEGQGFEIQGSGDNDHLEFTKDNGDIKISLKKRDFDAITMLKNILARGNKKLRGGN